MTDEAESLWRVKFIRFYEEEEFLEHEIVWEVPSSKISMEVRAEMWADLWNNLHGSPGQNYRCDIERIDE